MNQPMIEALDDEPLFYPVVWACEDIILQSLSRLGNGFIRELLEARDLIPKGIGLAQRKNLARNALEHFSQVDTSSLLA
jgi:hypothetical protein